MEPVPDYHIGCTYILFIPTSCDPCELIFSASYYLALNQSASLDLKTVYIFLDKDCEHGLENAKNSKFKLGRFY